MSDNEESVIPTEQVQKVVDALFDKVDALEKSVSTKEEPKEEAKVEEKKEPEANIADQLAEALERQEQKREIKETSNTYLNKTLEEYKSIYEKAGLEWDDIAYNDFATDYRTFLDYESKFSEDQSRDFNYDHVKGNTIDNLKKKIKKFTGKDLDEKFNIDF